MQGSLKSTDNIKITMDTVIIKIYSPRTFKISNFSLFLPEITRRTYEELSQTERTSRHPYLKRFVLRPKFQEEYLPRVELFETLTKDRKDIQHILKIELSIPKLLYWNSVQEVSNTDQQRVFSALRSALQSVGITIETEVISKAQVVAVHACKNILLPKNIKMREIINELGKIDISKVFDISDKQNKKGSRVLNIYAGTTDWSIYDKVSDSLRPKNKRTDKEHIDYERQFIISHNLENKEIFRYEYRIKKNQTARKYINPLLGREYETQLLFKDLFTPNLMKSLVINSWHTIINRPENQLSLFAITDKLTLLLHILAEAQKLDEKSHTLNKALISYGLAIAIKDHGAKEVRGAIFDIWDTNHPERLNKKIELASELIQGLPYSNCISFVNNALENFEFINLTSLEKGI